MNTPLVSIIIPSYNRAHLIGETLDSIIAQTYTNWECIIVDDGSLDNTKKLILNYIDKDARFRYHIRPKDRLKGGNSARNYGFEVSIGEYVNWFDSDDLMIPDKLENQLKLIIKLNSDVSVCHSQFFNENGMLDVFWSKFVSIYNDNITDFITYNRAWCSNAPLWKRSFLLNKILWNEDLLSSQDWEFNARMLINNPKVAFINAVLVHIRRHENNIGNHNMKDKLYSRINARKIVLELISDNKLMSNHIKNYFKRYFLNQLKYCNKENNLLTKNYLKNIKICSSYFDWNINLYPRILLYKFIFEKLNKKYISFKILFKQ
ncbi:glycosyltransferase [bacterium]|nr:glycosyltransferase [bacterium]